MRKTKRVRKFGRVRDERKAFLNSLASNLILKEKIKTTESRAKELSSFVAKIITKAKKGDISAKRIVSRYLPKKSSEKLNKEIAPRYKNRKGGYTRIIKLGPRKSDTSEMVIIELV